MEDRDQRSRRGYHITAGRVTHISHGSSPALHPFLQVIQDPGDPGIERKTPRQPPPPRLPAVRCSIGASVRLITHHQS